MPSGNQQQRGFTYLAALLLIASPAVGGQFMTVLHPCAVESASADQHAGHGAGHSSLPEDAHCSCIGSCQAPSYVAGPRPVVVVATVSVLPTVPLRVAETTPVIASDRPIDRLPPPTAPPIA